MIVCSFSAFLWFCVLCLALYILIHFLVIKKRCKQQSMIVFYAFSMTDLGSRLTYFILGCFYPQQCTLLVYIQGISTVASFGSGVTHSHNLSNLIFNLASVQNDNMGADE